MPGYGGNRVSKISLRVLVTVITYGSGQSQGGDGEDGGEGELHLDRRGERSWKIWLSGLEEAGDRWRRREAEYMLYILILQ